MSIEHNSSKRHFPDIPKPSDHMKFLAWGVKDQYTAIGLRRFGDQHNQCSEPFQRSQKQSLQKFTKWSDELEGEDKVYLTQACYHWGRRGDKVPYKTTSDYLSSIAVLFVDLDLYHAVENFGDSRTDQMRVVDAVLETCRNVGIPDPLLISSGRGMYAYWALSERLDIRAQDARQRWKSAQQRLMAVLTRFAPDPKVCDLTRVLRLVGTVNEKNGARVAVLHDDGRRYSLEHLEQALRAVEVVHCPEQADTVQSLCSKGPKRRARQAPDVKKSRTEIDSTSADNVDTRWKASPDAIDWLMNLIQQEDPAYDKLNFFQRIFYRIFRDIATVVKIREGIQIGQRDLFIFWMLVCRYHAGMCPLDELNYWAGEFAKLTHGELVLSSNGELSHLEQRMRRDSIQAAATGKITHSEVLRRRGAFSVVRYVKRYCTPLPIQICPKRARSAVYVPSVRTLLQRLSITELEQQSLETLIDDKERKRRRSMTQSRENRRLRREDILRRFRDGERVAHIASALELSRSSVYRCLKGVERAHAKTKADVSANTAARQSAPKKCRNRALVIDAIRTDPTLPLREIARRTGVPLTSVHRLLKSECGA